MQCLARSDGSRCISTSLFTELRSDAGAAAAEPFPDKAPTPGQHLKNVFYRMGLGDMEIVALSGAHTLGRAKPDRSGFGKEVTKYTKDGPGTPGARHLASWLQVWLPVTTARSRFSAAKALCSFGVVPLRFIYLRSIWDAVRDTLLRN